MTRRKKRLGTSALFFAGRNSNKMLSPLGRNEAKVTGNISAGSRLPSSKHRLVEWWLNERKNVRSKRHHDWFAGVARSVLILDNGFYPAFVCSITINEMHLQIAPLFLYKHLVSSYMGYAMGDFGRKRVSARRCCQNIFINLPPPSDSLSKLRV